MNLTWQQSIGIEQSHLTGFEIKKTQSFLVHQSIKQDLLNLFSTVKKDGLEIAIISSFRSFEQQLSIWNDKWQGHRPVYSRHGRLLNIDKMSDVEKYKAISLWSALPGLSRHHWGTDLDVFLAEPIQSGYKVKLMPQEFSKNGVCSELNSWMDKNLNGYGFFRPYRSFQQGISEEPWHISHRATSQEILDSFSFKECLNHINRSKIKSRDFICNNFEHYQQQYFLNLCD